MVSNVAISGDFAETNACTTINPGSTYNISVTFKPTALGSRSGSLAITDNDASESQTVALTGAAIDLEIAPSGSSSTGATINAGQTATYNLQAAPTGFTGNVSLTCSGAPAAASCTINPNPVVVNGVNAAQFTVTVMTTARSILAPPNVPLGRAPISFPLFIIVGMAAGSILILVRASPTRFLPALLTLVMIVFAGLLLSACGSGSTTTTTSPTGTPAGTSTLTITATVGGATRTQTLTLTVN